MKGAEVCPGDQVDSKQESKREHLGGNVEVQCQEYQMHLHFEVGAVGCVVLQPLSANANILYMQIRTEA